MNFEQQAEQLEHTYERYLVLILKQLIKVLQIAIPFCVNFSKENPTMFLAIVTFALLYITWKIVKNIYVIIRRLISFYLIVLAISIYLRGWDQFINYDVPYFYNNIMTVDNGYKFGMGIKYSVVQLKFYLNYLYHYLEGLQ